MKNHLIKIFIVIYISFLQNSFSKTGKYPVLIFPIETIGNENINCTSTLLKSNQRCHLISNYHCLGQNYTTVNLINNSKVELKVKKTNLTLDLIEFEVPKSLSPFCNELENANLEKIETFEDTRGSFSTIGYVNNKIHQYYSDDFSWSVGHFPTDYFTERYQVSKDQYYLKLKALKLIPGMSGGALLRFNQDEYDFYGLNTRFVPFNNESYFIPRSFIKSFLMESKTNKGNSTYLKKGYSSHFIKSKGKFVGNSHGDVGNSHGDVGSIDKRFKEKNVLNHFLEEEEGIVLGEKRLQGVFYNNQWMQIDSIDDYLSYFSNESNNLLFANMNDKKLNKDIKKNIFKRLDDYYNSLLLGNSIKRHNVFIKDKNEAYGFKQISKSHNIESFIDFNDKSKSLEIYIQPHFLSELTDVTRGVLKNDYVDELHLFFKLKFFDESFDKVILESLTDKKYTMECDNNNFLKLICHNKEMAFSLSKRKLGQSRLHFRLTFINENQKIDHYFGELKSVLEKRQWR